MQLVIFDWEGTLIKDLDAQFQCLETCAKYQGHKLIRNHKVYSSPWHFLDSPVNGLSHIQSAQLRQAFSMALQDLEKVSETTLKVLQALKAKGIQVAIATNLNRAAFDDALERSGCKSFIDFSATPTEYEPKPSPAMLNGIVENLRCVKDKTLFVGDSAIDIEAAKAAHIKSCWFTSSDGLRPEPTYWLSQMSDLMKLNCF